MSDIDTDAARSAVAICRGLLAGDPAPLDIIPTLEDAEMQALCGALAAIATASLRTVEAVIFYAKEAGYCTELPPDTAEQVLAGMQRQLAMQ